MQCHLRAQPGALLERPTPTVRGGHSKYLITWKGLPLSRDRNGFSVKAGKSFQKSTATGPPIESCRRLPYSASLCPRAAAVSGARVLAHSAILSPSVLFFCFQRPELKPAPLRNPPDNLPLVVLFRHSLPLPARPLIITHSLATQSFPTSSRSYPIAQWECYT